MGDPRRGLDMAVHGAEAPIEHVSAAELVRPLLLRGEGDTAAGGHHALATRLLGPAGKPPGQRHWEWRENPVLDTYELVCLGRRALVVSRRGLLREAAVVALAADLQGRDPRIVVLEDEGLAAATVLVESGAVDLGTARPQARHEPHPHELEARRLAEQSPYSFRTCLELVRAVGPRVAERLVEAAAGMGDDPIRLAQMHLAGVMTSFDPPEHRDYVDARDGYVYREDYLGEIRPRYFRR